MSTHTPSPLEVLRRRMIGETQIMLECRGQNPLDADMIRTMALVIIADVAAKFTPPAHAEAPDTSAMRRMSWPGRSACWLSAEQARVLDRLCLAFMNDRPEVPERVLLAAARVPAGTVAELFEGSAAWNELVTPGNAPGTFRLPPLPEPPAEGGA